MVSLLLFWAETTPGQGDRIGFHYGIAIHQQESVVFLFNYDSVDPRLRRHEGKQYEQREDAPEWPNHVVKCNEFARRVQCP